MGFWEVFLIGIGLAMDAFAVSVGKGLATPKYEPKGSLICGLWFGGFQMLMPLIGCFLGTQFAGYIESVDHWIAFVLSAAGVRIGSIFGEKYASRAELAGGALLILMGTRILLSHLGVL